MSQSQAELLAEISRLRIALESIIIEGVGDASSVTAQFDCTTCERKNEIAEKALKGGA